MRPDCVIGAQFVLVLPFERSAGPCEPKR